MSATINATSVDDTAVHETTDTELASLVTRESKRSRRSDVGSRSIPVSRRRWWLVGGVVAVVWSLRDAGVGSRPQVNGRGWSLVGKFLHGALRPVMPTGFWHATFVTLSYAVVGTVLSVVIGAVVGVMVAEASWRKRLASSERERRAGWLIMRALLAVPRGIHEAVWGLLLVNVLGLDPLVGVLAIAIPFGAITAKVYADLLDEEAGGLYCTLRAGGSSRRNALLYGAVPTTAADLVSYGFYRFECSIRSAAVLGLIGAGGLGFQLKQAFDGLDYGRMWFVIDALVALSLLGEVWSAFLRRGRSRRSGRSRRAARESVIVAIAAFVAAVRFLHIDPTTPWSARTRDLAARIGRQAWPPKLPDGGWRAIATAVRETVQMSLLAIVIAATVAAVVSVVWSRDLTGHSRVAQGVGALVRLVALLARAVPPSAWALLVVFVVFPGPLPGAIALGIYTFGVLARLFSEAMENVDHRPAQALRLLGSSRPTTFAYGVLPIVTPKWQAYSLYRWEVAARETVIVGMVGAGGLGRVLSRQVTAFDYRAMVVTLGALIAMTLLVDLVSAAARRAFR